MALAATVGAWASWTRRDAMRLWLLDPPLGDAPPGRLDPSTADVLAATVTALVDTRVEPVHYLEMFRWRAEHVPGARALYRRFEHHVERAAAAAGAASYVDAPLELRRRILAGLRPARGRGRLGRVLLARDEDRIARHVVREVYRHFARTDAWLRVGYESWPGMPRGIARFPVETPGS
jgi:hypothetical protein